MVGNGFGSRFDCSLWFWVVLGPDLVVGVMDFNGWMRFCVYILWFWMVLGGSGSRFNRWGPGFYWLDVVLDPDLMVLGGSEWF